MSSIVTAVFKATIGLLVNKGRDKAAERLKDGDVTEQKFRSVIIREIDDIKSKLDGLSRKDLLASISFFEEGIELLYEVFDKARSRSEGDKEPVQAAYAEAFALAEEMQNMKLTGLDESATRALANAKKRFKDARREATRAFKNEALTTSDRILAMEYRVMATILETIDNPADAIACIKEINSLSAVQNSFNVELRRGIMARFNKDGRGKIISSVCHVNRVVFDVTRAVGKEVPFWMWPRVDTEEGNIDPLRDVSIVEVLCKQGMEHCFFETAPWSFGQEGVEEHRLENPCGMAMNSKGHYIITDNWYGDVKVFDSRGQFMDHVSFPFHETLFEVFDVSVDMNDTFYVLVRLYELDYSGSKFVVYMFNNNGEVHHQFPVKGELYHINRPAMIVDSKRKVVITGIRFLLEGDVVNVYENDGQFLRSFGEGLLGRVIDLALASDDRVIALDGDSCVHMFSEHGDHLSKFKLSTTSIFTCRFAFHHSSEHVVVADLRVDSIDLHIFIKDGKRVRKTEIYVEGIAPSQRGMIVTAEGHVALLSHREIFNSQGRVFIVC